MLGHELNDAAEQVRPEDDAGPGRADAAAALADRIVGLASSATGADGVIRVTVGTSGTVSRLELDDRVRRFTGEQLSEEILRVMRRAQAGLAEQVAAAVNATVGADSDTGQAVLQSFTSRFPTEPGGTPEPVMPAPPPFPAFHNRPSLPHQAPGGGFSSGRDSRAR